MKDLKSRTLRGGVAKGGAQAANLLLRLGCLVVLARLLEPTDFGLVGMVTAITGVLALFREFGLSLATIQRLEVTEAQTSTLFWVNVAVGVALFLLSVAVAPFVASFYREPRLTVVMMVLGLAFVFNAGGVQHSALLQRQMRFTALAVIEVFSLLISSAISLLLAVVGFGYWALVAWSVTLPLASTIQLWIYSRWVPGRPTRNAGAGSLLRFGGLVTLNTLVVYVAYNLDKVLLGRFWGAEVVGIYGRAFQLVTMPTEQINGTFGSIAIALLSRVQDDRNRLWAYFLKSYSLVLAVTVPVAILCAIFADAIILTMFGPNWSNAVPVFRYLAPTVLVLAIINPPGWLLVALGMIPRSLKVALVLAPVVITGCVIGLPYGANGVALGYSIAMVSWVVPHLYWCFHGMGISMRDVALAIGRPLVSGIAGAAVTLGALAVAGEGPPPFVILIIGSAIFMAVYLSVLLFVMKQNAFYLDIIRGLRERPTENAFVQP
jgi:PST family polysaccharide transporter